jgi:hypothetical protein
MAIPKIQGPRNQDSHASQPYPGPGPYIAEVVSHHNTDLNGTLSVVLKKGMMGNNTNTTVYQARYLSPFMGTTPWSEQGKNSRSSADAVSSYGMFMVPPDVGNLVLVTFADGSGDNCFWIGCVPPPANNYAMFGPTSSKETTALPQAKKNMSGSGEYIPVKELNTRFSDQNNPAVEDANKPRVPDYDASRILAFQGLMRDTARGLPSSSPRRNLPNSVFGFSSPGPNRVGENAKKALLGISGEEKWTYTERLGGSAIIFDDGQIDRDTNGKTGITDESLRIRTRTGHQIVMHNTHDFIYICNSRGTAWIEMTSNGKIDIFAEDSVSIHSSNDFNFRADRDVNIEAGRAINMRSVKGSFSVDSGGDAQILAFNGASISARIGNVSLDAGLAPNIITGGKVMFKGYNGVDMLGGSLAPFPNVLAESRMWFSGGLVQNVGPLGVTTNTLGSYIVNSTLGQTFNSPLSITHNTLGFMTQRAGTSYSLSAGASMNISSVGPWGITGESTGVVQSTGALVVGAGGALTVDAKGVLQLQSTGAVNVVGSAAVTVSGTAVALAPPTPPVVVSTDSVSAASKAVTVESAAAAVGTVATIVQSVTALVPPSISTTTKLDPKEFPNRLSSADLSQKQTDARSDKTDANMWSQDWYKTSNLSSICGRVPTHEPWDHHENLDPAAFTADKTNSSAVV